MVPVLYNLHLDVFFFSVPNRLVWDNWQKFMGEQANPGDSTDYNVPQCVAPGGTGFPVESMGDYFGLPTGVPGITACALPFRAYNLIYNEWFRDENLQASVTVPKGDGPDQFSDGYYALRRRGKRHDYFTSCLPWPQKGEAVSIGVTGSAPVVPDLPGNAPTWVTANIGAGDSWMMYREADNNVRVTPTASATGDVGPLGWKETHLVADLSTASSVTINQLRQAFQVQRLLERDARGGTRYTEILRSHFGVVSPDARLQRPEFLGGGSVPVTINPVVQNSGTANDPSTGYSGTPQGNLAAYGVVASNNMGFSKSFVEHSIVIGLMMVRADLSYQQGMARMWSRKTRYDFYWPAFSHLGEQAVLNKEIYCQGTAADEQVFGYQERWAEYRYFPSKITGKFRSTDAQSLDVWHYAQEFGSLPVLGATFIEDATDTVVNRSLAIQDEPQFLFDSHIRIQAVRPMPTYSVPGLIDHF